jgi:hypothetical protein
VGTRERKCACQRRTNPLHLIAPVFPAPLGPEAYDAEPGRFASTQRLTQSGLSTSSVWIGDCSNCPQIAVGVDEEWELRM